ncbi:hypothetical protein [Nostoc sp. CCY 9925]|uniref:hypothetical protein n=1 Tax=Nostoc sp. CCY 9925 TaxID=3103865 RepID=UPI0039C6233A
MCLQREAITPVTEQTVCVAFSAFPKHFTQYRIIPIIHEYALNIKKRTAKYAKEERGN